MSRRLADMPDFLTVSEVAELLGTGETVVQSAINKGDLHAVRLGGRTQRIPKSALVSHPVAGEGQLMAAYVVAHDALVRAMDALMAFEEQSARGRTQLLAEISQATAEAAQAWRSWQLVRDAASEAA